MQNSKKCSPNPWLGSTLLYLDSLKKEKLESTYFKHDLKIFSTITGKIAIETGLAGQGQISLIPD